MRLGVVGIGRTTFDVPLAEATFEAARATLAAKAEIIGPDHILFSADELAPVIETLEAAPLDRVVVLQASFADAGMVQRLAAAIDAPFLLWGFPEARWGGRPRLNSLCGINLAAHALGRLGTAFNYLYAAPDEAEALEKALARPALDAPEAVDVIDADPVAEAEAADVLNALHGARIGLVGCHPDGFETCRYDEAWLARELGVTIEAIDLANLFARARELSEDDLTPIRQRVAGALEGVAALEDQAAVEGTLRLYETMARLARAHRLEGMAVRCWPESFTEMGCAFCGAMAWLNEDQVPAACEADIHGDITNLILQALAAEPPWVVDLVDMEDAGNTGVVWHCGLAPSSMADPDVKPRADLHANRRKPLLQAFPLKPGRITLARLSWARNEPKLVIGAGEMVKAPMSYSGTSGVVRFDRRVDEVLDRLMGLGLEHHVSFAYGEHRPALRALAGRLRLPVVELC